MNKMLVVIVLSIFLFVTYAPSPEVSSLYDLCDLVGYTIIACANSKPRYELPEPGERDLIELSNGMIFEFVGLGPISRFSREECVVFAAEVKASNTILHRLLIDDRVYQVIRLR